MLQIYPEKYDQLDLSLDEKSFLRTIERAFSNEKMAYFVLHINPRKKDIGMGKPELFNLLLIKEGILLFRFLDYEDIASVTLDIQVISDQKVYDLIETDIVKRLEESRYLTNDFDGKLRYKLNICFVYPKIESWQILNVTNDSLKEFCHHHVIFKNDIMQIRHDGPNIIKQYLYLNDINALELQENLINNIFQRLCPEIIIPHKYTLNEYDKVDGIDGKLNNSDRAVQSYRLDNRQIDLVNKIAKGNQLILACAGSGKSVLLVSKCFKLASLNPAEQFLITCYNRNLNNYYQWIIAQAGFLDKNVQCLTFFFLCKQLMESNNLAVPSMSKNKQDDYYDSLFEAANNALFSGKIKERFYGIFIDEVQIFKPEWYKFCFNLLKSKNPSEHFFIIAGDKSQDIKNNIKHGKAPWQGGGDEYPDYRGKTLPIEINYRNSKPINDAIDRFVENSKLLSAKLGIDLSSDPELFLRGKAYKEGNIPTLIELLDLSNDGEGRAIGDSIKEFIENKKLSEVDIAVVLFNKTGLAIKPWASKTYNLLPSIKRYFYSQQWEAPAILIKGESEGITYGSRRGVTITTIEGSLGLDFRAVVLAGLRPLGIHEQARSLSDFTDFATEKSEAFQKNINLLYTGLTRARDELTIVLSTPRGESIYMDLLRDSMGNKTI